MRSMRPRTLRPSRSTAGSEDPATPNELSPALRFIGSHISRLILSPTRKRIFDGVREQIRQLRGAPHRVHYFHEIGDPYSHLAAQTLRSLLIAANVARLRRGEAPYPLLDRTVGY